MWPTEADLLAQMGAAGLVSDPLPLPLRAVDFQGMIDAAVEEVERASGHQPFLATEAGTARDFALTGLYADNTLRSDRLPRLRLRGGAVEVSAVRLFGATGGVLDDTGEALTPETDYRLEPVDAPAQGRPYTTLALTAAWRRLLRSPSDGGAGLLRITGRFGFAASVPADLRRAVLAAALAEAAPVCLSYAFLAAGGQVGVKREVEIGPVKETVAPTGTTGASVVLMGDAGQREAALNNLRRLARRYRAAAIA